jgi:outer membrane cobalamin receptor
LVTNFSIHLNALINQMLPIMRPFLFSLFLSISHVAFAQQYTISGTVTDVENLEVLIGANIYEPVTLNGTTSNNFGFYSLTLPSDTVEVRYSFVGYQATTLRFLLHRDTVIDMSLQASTLLEEVVVQADIEESIQESSQMSSVSIPVSSMAQLPAFLGEVDVLKTLQLLPGVQSGSEGSSGLYVRGGGPDQNLILLDGVPVYNAAHLFGFFSVFNSDAINNVTLIKGGFPARYGGRLSSVIDVQAKEGNMSEFHGEGSIGLISSRLTLEGPIVKKKSSFIVSARRTYADLIFGPMVKAASDGNETVGYFFYDLNAKVNYKLSNKNRVFLSAYLGKDRASSTYKENSDFGRSYDDEFNLKWGNVTTALRWNSILSKKLFSNTLLTFSRYNFDLTGQSLETFNVPDAPPQTDFYKQRYYSQIRDFAAKIDFDYIPTPNHYIRFGINAIHHRFTPGAASYVAQSQTTAIDSTFGADQIDAMEYSGYFEDDFKIGSKLKINVGLHASAFKVRDELYTSLQPRISARYLLAPTLSLKGSYAEMTQFIHLLTNSGLGLPTDLWVPATDKIRPQNSRQVALGIAKNYKQKYEVSVEAFYKTMDNLIEYREGASFLNPTESYENKVEIGSGDSYGAEFFFQKKLGSLTGWLGYTLSWSNRTFANINEGKTFPYKYDRRHDISLALVKTFNKRVSFSAAWVYGTGNAISLPRGTYPAMDSNWRSNIEFHGNRNEYRMRSYHRLDLSVSLKKVKKWGERTWTFGLYNVYSRRNPFYLDVSYSNGNQPSFIQYSLFPILPSIRYSFKF